MAGLRGHPYPMSQLPSRLGVVGAGTMGAGIAQLGCLAEMETVLHDPVAGALERGADSVRAGLAKGAQRGRWSQEDARAAGERLRLSEELEELADCELVIEAAPERPDLKRELFERLSEVCADDAVLASNTSSILVSSLAAAAAHPENVVGMHFFNPPPLMRLLEVIAAAQTGDRALWMARAVGEAMGKTVIVASDGPGFLVNRCGRPVNGEALRLLQERVATVEQIDRIARLGGGFRMGPFELMDLVGIDVGYEVARSFNEQSFGEPRWKPSMLQARMVAAGTLGRKTSRGWYSYEDGPHRPDDEDPPAAGGGDGRTVAIAGWSCMPRRETSRPPAGPPWRCCAPTARSRPMRSPALAASTSFPRWRRRSSSSSPACPTRATPPPMPASASSPRSGCTTSGWLTRPGSCSGGWCASW
jgi:3-hydroxybutyryl-CoA dehydrogenase